MKPIITITSILIFLFGIDFESHKRLETEVQENAQFGWAVDINGEIAVVSSAGFEISTDSDSNLSGAVEVFNQSSTGDWEKIQTILAPDPSRTAGFGSSISLSENYLFVGAPLDRFNSQSKSTFERPGSVFVYKLNQLEKQWRLDTVLVKPNRELHDEFGRSLVQNGHHSVISERKSHNGQYYLYTKDDYGIWRNTDSKTSNSGIYNAMSLSSNRLAYSRDAQRKHHNEPEYSKIKEVVISDITAEGKLKDVAVLSPNIYLKDMHFGIGGLHLENEICLVQSYFENECNESKFIRGNIHVFKEQADRSWIETDKVKSPFPNSCDGFGHSIDSNGNLVVIGSMGDALNGDEIRTQYLGRTYLYELTEEGKLNLVRDYREPTNLPYTKYGFSVAIDDQNIIIGSRLEDRILKTDTIKDIGAAYIHTIPN